MFRQLYLTLLYILFCCSTYFCEQNQNQKDTQDGGMEKIPRDRITLRKGDVLIFYRGKSTTYRRTHPIPQLSCVGGTAGCKLFTTNSVQCTYNGNSEDRRPIDWECEAKMSDRVKFNHVEVICEGYDYAEDDHILVGSCGLEFTVDYVDPHDYHHHSYFHHLDEDEKEKHHRRMNSAKSVASTSKFGTLLTYLFCAITIVLVLLLVWLRFIKKSRPRMGFVEGRHKRGQALQKVSMYQQSASFLINSDKRCE